MSGIVSDFQPPHLLYRTTSGRHIDVQGIRKTARPL